MENLIFVPSFFLGFAGSLHCFGMCGPIAFSIIMNNDKKFKIKYYNIYYQLGRIFSYTFLGFIFGIMGYGFSIVGIQKIISITLGINMIFSVFLPKNFFFSNKKLNYYNDLLKKISFFIKKRNFYYFFLTGIFNGFLPCGLVYTGLTVAMSSCHILSGAFFMLCFGLGTLPLMFFTVFLGNFIRFYIQKNILYFIPITLFIVGVILIFRGSGLGIPYLSPS